MAMIDMDWKAIANPLSKADRVISRLDERLSSSPLRKGLLARFDLNEALSVLANEGVLVHFEDLALHDVDMDIRTPTQEILRAEYVLGIRRKAAERPPDRLLTLQGMQSLVGAWAAKTPIVNPPIRNSSTYVAELLALAESLTSGEDTDFAEDEDAQPPDVVFDEWRNSVQQITAKLPPVLAAAQIMLDWRRAAPIPNCEWLGPLVAGIYLRKEGITSFLLPVHLGWRLARRQNIKHPPLRMMLESIYMAATDGLEANNRLEASIRRLKANVADKRGESFDALIQILIDHPVVTTATIVKTMRMTKQGAAHLLKAVGPLRELTGRDKYRAWGI